MKAAFDPILKDVSSWTPRQRAVAVYTFFALVSIFADWLQQIILTIVGFQYAVFSHWGEWVMLAAVGLYYTGAAVSVTLQGSGLHLLNPVFSANVAHVATGVFLVFVTVWPVPGAWLCMAPLLGLAKTDASAISVIFFSSSGHATTSRTQDELYRVVHLVSVFADCAGALVIMFVYYYPRSIPWVIGGAVVFHFLSFIAFLFMHRRVSRMDSAERSSLGIGAENALDRVSQPFVDAEDYRPASDSVSSLEQKIDWNNEANETLARLKQARTVAHQRTRVSVQRMVFLSEFARYANQTFMYTVVITLDTFNAAAMGAVMCIVTLAMVAVLVSMEKILTHARVIRFAKIASYTGVIAAFMSAFFLAAYRDASTVHLVIHGVYMLCIGPVQLAPIFIGLELTREIEMPVASEIASLTSYQYAGRAFGVICGWVLFVHFHVAPYFVIAAVYAFIARQHATRMDTFGRLQLAYGRSLAATISRAAILEEEEEL